MENVRMLRPASGPGPVLLRALLAAAGAAAMTAAAITLWIDASSSPPTQALITWVLVGVAATGFLLCLYLTLIWALAAAVLLSGPATRTGAALLGALKVLAPHLARRVTTGAAVATTATALVLAPSMASEAPPQPAPLSEHAPAHSAQYLPAERVIPDPAPEAAAPGAPEGTSSRTEGAPLPGLGWTESEPVAPEEPRAVDDPAPQEPLTVTVRHGDSLWSISEDLLGPAPSDSAAIAAAWPLLHETNEDLIGEDPDELHPGMELTVPASLTPEDLP